MTLTSIEQITQWLNEHNGFSNAKLSYNFNPLTKTLNLTIENRQELRLAGEKETIKIISIQASEVEVISGQLLDSESSLNLYQIHPLADNLGIIFDVWGKDESSFKFKKLVINQTKEEERIVKPTLNKNILEFKIHSNEMPRAIYWLERLKEKGFDATYITYFGNDMSKDEITNYAGLSIRPVEKAGTVHLGLKFCKVKCVQGFLEIVVELQNNELKDFWQAFVKILSEMELIQVKSGNVTFTSKEWIKVLNDGTFW